MSKRLLIVLTLANVALAILPGGQDCPQKLMNEFKTNPFSVLKINNLLMAGSYDELTQVILRSVNQQCSEADKSAVNGLMQQYAPTIGLVKELLDYVTPQEREQLKTWILTDQKTAISFFMMQKGLQFALNPEVSAKLFQLMTQLPLLSSPFSQS